jgi:hypothetical protein
MRFQLCITRNAHWTAGIEEVHRLEAPSKIRPLHQRRESPPGTERLTPSHPTAVIDLRQSPGPLSAGSSASPGSTGRLRLGEFPCSVKDLGSWAEEAHPIVPALHDRQTIGSFAIKAAKLNGDRTVLGLFALMIFTE